MNTLAKVGRLSGTYLARNGLRAVEGAELVTSVLGVLVDGPLVDAETIGSVVSQFESPRYCRQPQNLWPRACTGLLMWTTTPSLNASSRSTR